MFLNSRLFLDPELDKKEKILYQPEFPLVYDGIHGPYRPITNVVDSLQADFLHLLQTSPGEWPFEPDLGVGLKHYLFEFHGSEKLLELQPVINDQISKYLPQIELLDLQFIASDQEVDEAYTTLRLTYSILNSELVELIAKFDKLNSELQIELESIQSNMGLGDALAQSLRSPNDVAII